MVHTMTPARSLLLVALLACSRSSPELAQKDAAAPLPAGTSPWNTEQIDWKPYDEGMAIAKRDNKPVVLVFYTSWCAHCKNYSRVFDDPRVTERSHDFVMIRLDADANEAVARKYHPDGTYVPRTFILQPDGSIDPEGHADNPRYAHFFDEKNPQSILAAMDRVAFPAHR